MKNNNKLPIFIMTLVLLAGFVFSIGFWKTKIASERTCYVNNKYYKAGESFFVSTNNVSQQCTCLKDGKVACTQQEQPMINNKSDNKPSIEQWTRSGLTFSTILINKVNINELSTEQASVSSLKMDRGFLRAHIIDIQRCSKDGNVMKQVGFYYYDDKSSTLYLTSMINNSNEDLDSGFCRVDLGFDVLGLKINSSTLTINYIRDDQSAIEKACIYEHNLYKNNDAFQGVDGCSVCHCENGDIKCEDNENCSKVEDSNSNKSQSVYKDYPDFDRYEKPEKYGECLRDDQCYVSGCNNEVCSATKSVKTSCEVVSTIEDASCKCVDSKCIWTK